MSLRQEFVTLASREGANVRELCRRFGVSPPTAYKWLARFRAAGAAGLADRPRRPHASPGRTADAVERAVLDLRGRHPAWGGRKLRRRLLALGHATVPSASTITAILRRHDALGAAAGRPRDFTRFTHEAPNRLWQMDFKGHFALGAGRCHPLTVLDDHSRYALGLFACADERDGTVRARLTEVFRRYGLPDRILCDNGPPWGAAGAAEPHTALSVWLLRLGVGVCRGRPYHPQTQGKDERFHRTLRAEVLQGPPFPDAAACQARFDAWRRVYNHERPHEALGLAVPAEHYCASPRPFPESPPEPAYDAGDGVRKVQADGSVSFRGRPVAVGKAFRGERVALRATAADGVWAVYYGVHRLASVDLRRQNGDG